jgi:hypothetical protein
MLFPRGFATTGKLYRDGVWWCMYMNSVILYSHLYNYW